MRPHHGAVEHLNQMRGRAGLSQELEEGLEHARVAQAPESLPGTVPRPELGRRRPSGGVVDRVVVQRLQEPPVVTPIVATTRATRNTSSTTAQSCSVILVSMVGLPGTDPL
jgi:hypothetical protein